MHKPTPQPIKHQGHKWRNLRGIWGPHRVKVVCVDCGNEFVKWGPKKSKP